MTTPQTPRSFDPEYDDVSGAGWIISDDYFGDTVDPADFEAAEFEAAVDVMADHLAQRITDHTHQPDRGDQQ